MHRFLRPILVAAITLSVSSPLLAQSYGQVKGMNERFRMDFGGFFQDFTTTFRLDPANGTGTEISLEDDLGYDTSKTSFRTDGYWRFGPRGRMDFAYQTFRRGSTHRLDRDFVIGDTTYHAGASVDSSSRVDVGDLYYSYSLLNSGEAEVGLMLGASTFWTKWEFEASGAISGGGGTQAGSVQRETSDLIVPIPAVGAHFRYTLLPGFLATARVKYMKATISDYTGKMLDWRAGLDYFFTPNVGIGAVWSSTDIEVTKRQDKGDVSFEYKYDGPLAYVSIAF
ncbi:MAG: hypothetical protein U0529_07900 [Thermoanaerobaculia bacterium]